MYVSLLQILSKILTNPIDITTLLTQTLPFPSQAPTPTREHRSESCGL